MLPDEPGSHNHNYCRNEPGQSGTRSKGAWCYTTDPTKLFEECSCNKQNVTTSCCQTIKVLLKSVTVPTTRSLRFILSKTVTI